MPEAHAKLSPSGADCWMTCPGSKVLFEGMPEQSSVYAAEGTRAHAMAEAWLNGAYTLISPAGDSTILEMEKHVLIYVNHIHHLKMLNPGNRAHIEVKVSVTEHCWGTADAIVWDPTTCTLYVRDLKYGAGVGVEVGDNRQLKIYALAALLTMGYPAERVDVGIVQPRLPHVDGMIRSKEYDSVDLIDFHADLLDAAQRVRDAFFSANMPEMSRKAWEDEYLKPSEKGCKWCLAAPKCPLLKSKAQDLAKRVFTPDLAYDPKELAATLDFIPILKAWIANVDSFAYNEAEAGRVPPTYKLVEKRASRKWKADFDYRDLLKALGRKDTRDIYKLELLPIGDILKMCPGKNAEERKAVLEPFTVTESSGHTLVHESDKRDPVRLDAKAAFAPAGETASL